MSELQLTLSLGGVILALAVSLWPRYGLWARWQSGRRLQMRCQIEDALKHIHALNRRGATASSEALAGALRLPWRTIVALIERMQREGLIESAEQGLRLTAAGNDLALHVIRAHRLWERHLADQAGWRLADLHAEADRREHVISDAELAAMEADLGYPRRDPHGDPIPTAAGDLPDNHQISLAQWPVGAPGEITHIEDEPGEVFAQIVALSLKPGLPVRVIESAAARVVFETGDAQHVLAPIIAGNIFIEAAHTTQPAGQPLTVLRVGQRAQITALADACQGLTRRRFLDLGLTPGTTVESALANPFRDPVAYRVRGSLIALRREQAEHVFIDPNTIAKGNAA